MKTISQIFYYIIVFLIANAMVRACRNWQAGLRPLPDKNSLPGYVFHERFPSTNNDYFSRLVKRNGNTLLIEGVSQHPSRKDRTTQYLLNCSTNYVKYADE